MAPDPRPHCWCCDCDECLTWEKPSGNDSTNGSRARACHTPDAILQTPDATLTAPRSATPDAPATRRGTRIPDDFAVDDAMRVWAHERGWTDAAINAVTEEFVDYWRSCSVRATKLDWTLTWKNRLRDQERRRPGAGDAPSRFAGHLELVEKLRTEEGR